MKKSKKLLALLMTGVMTLSVLAGCGGSNDATDPAPTDPSQTAAQTTEAPQTGEKVELTVWITSRNQDEFQEERKAEFLKPIPTSP